MEFGPGFSDSNPGNDYWSGTGLEGRDPSKISNIISGEGWVAIDEVKKGVTVLGFLPTTYTERTVIMQVGDGYISYSDVKQKFGHASTYSNILRNLNNRCPETYEMAQMHAGFREYNITEYIFSGARYHGVEYTFTMSGFQITNGRHAFVGLDDFGGCECVYNGDGTLDDASEFMGTFNFGKDKPSKMHTLLDVNAHEDKIKDYAYNKTTILR